MSDRGLPQGPLVGFHSGDAAGTAFMMAARIISGVSGPVPRMALFLFE